MIELWYRSTGGRHKSSLHMSYRPTEVLTPNLPTAGRYLLLLGASDADKASAFAWRFRCPQSIRAAYRSRKPELFWIGIRPGQNDKVGPGACHQRKIGAFAGLNLAQSLIELQSRFIACGRALPHLVAWEVWMAGVLKVSVVTIGVMLCAVPAAAQSAKATCATRAVKAVGATALLEGAARGKARSAWMQRVSASKRLGPSYATWLRAKDPSYACKHTGKRYSCVARAVPCKV